MCCSPRGSKHHSKRPIGSWTHIALSKGAGCQLVSLWLQTLASQWTSIGQSPFSNVACMEGIERGWGSGGRKKRRGLGKRGEGTPVKKPSFVHFPPIFDLPFPFLTFSPPPPPPLFLLLARRLSLTGRQEVISSHVYRLPKLSGLTMQLS